MDSRVKRDKMIRGYILKALRNVYPESMLVESIRSSVITPLYEGVIDAMPYLQYLVDKKYIDIFTKTTDIKFTFKCVRLLAKGIDLLEGTIVDPGVILNGGE